jgi:hypothetical protein
VLIAERFGRKWLADRTPSDFPNLNLADLSGNGGKTVCMERIKIQVLTDETLEMRAKASRLLKAPVKQKISRETELKSEVLDGVHRFHCGREN